MMMMFVFILVAIVLAVFFPVGLEDPADPTDNLYVPKPEWYFMALYQLLKYFPGKLETIATAIVPAGGMVMLLLLPFIDKNPEQKTPQTTDRHGRNGFLHPGHYFADNNWAGIIISGRSGKFFV